jgi:hypothetical protein
MSAFSDFLACLLRYFLFPFPPLFLIGLTSQLFASRLLQTRQTVGSRDAKHVSSSANPGLQCSVELACHTEPSRPKQALRKASSRPTSSETSDRKCGQDRTFKGLFRVILAIKTETKRRPDHGLTRSNRVYRSCDSVGSLRRLQGTAFNPFSSTEDSGRSIHQRS